MRLFHITCIQHSLKITADEYLEVTESNIGAPEIMNLNTHRNIAAAVDVAVNNNDPELVMVWNPTGEKDVVTVPRDILAKLERNGTTYRRLTPEEITAEIGDTGRYKAKIVVGIEQNQTVDGKFGDILTETDAYDGDLSPYGEHIGPDVVWLTLDATPRQSWAHHAGRSWDDIPPEYRKDTILFEVEVPDEEVFKWSEWAFDQGINKNWYEALSYGLRDHENWYVVPRRIPVSEWKSAFDLRTGECLWMPPGTYEEECQEADGSMKEGHRSHEQMPEPWVPRNLTREWDKKGGK